MSVVEPPAPRPPKKHKKVYFIYYRKRDNKPFYFDAREHTTQWRYPTDGVVYDPATKKPIPAPEIPNRRATVVPMVRRPPIPTEWIPAGLSADADSNTIEDLAAQLFRPVKGMDTKELASFSTKKPTSGLLASLDKNAGKKALKLFKMVLDYIGVGDSKKPPTITEITSFANESSLIDELYAEILKQSNDVPEPHLESTSTLLASICPVYLPSPELIPFVRSQLARMAKIDKIRTTMMRAYFRFTALVHLGAAPRFEGIPSNDIMNAPMQYGVSLYENMWNQRNTHRSLPIPHILVYCQRMLVEKGCASTEGIFRLPGNMKLVEQLIGEANQKDDGYLATASVNDVGSFYKQWFREIPGGLVDNEHTQRLLVTRKEEFVALADSLEELHRNVLMNLIGFLRELATHKAVTKMDEANLSMVFGPNIIDSGNVENPMKMAAMSSTSRDFIATLISEWDVSPIYPL